MSSAPAHPPKRQDGGPSDRRLSLGVAARLSRYLQVLTQARKMDRETISSQELSDYTHVNATQIRRDLSGFGRFGKRGVGYSVDGLIDQIQAILRTSEQINIALVGAGRLGRAIGSSDLFADHGFEIRAVIDADPDKVGTDLAGVKIRPMTEMAELIKREEIVVAVLAVPSQEAQAITDQLVQAGLKIIFNYSGGLVDVPQGVIVHTSSPAVELLHALYFYLA
ncbi:MAG: redox-sensing transcriptional repressor Rex [Solirubrobacteraceae bacterium]|nr:redox-sensing transcriptional repressor Rex [Solirubrobacteraceae bacterium]